MLSNHCEQPKTSFVKKRAARKQWSLKGKPSIFETPLQLKLVFYSATNETLFANRETSRMREVKKPRMKGVRIML